MAHDKNAEAGRRFYDLSITTAISLALDQATPANGAAVKADDLLVVHLAETPSNWTTDAKTGKRF